MERSRNHADVLSALEDHFSPLPSVEQVYYDYGPRVYSTARRMLSNDLDAEDVTQDVLLQVVRKLPSFRGESAFPTWLHRITVNAALTHRRRRQVREEHRVQDPLDLLLDHQQVETPGRPWMLEPGTQLLNQETSQRIRDAIDDLPETYRDVFVLADVEGLPNAEVADQVGLSLPAMKSRLHRARLLLREALAPYFVEVGI